MLVQLIGNNFVLQDDGTSCHRAKRVKDFLKRAKWVTIDLKPIENLWAYLKGTLSYKNYSSTTELKARIIGIWHLKMGQTFLE